MKKKYKIFCVIGTRPEFIKMAPVFKALKQKTTNNNELEIKWVLSSQHKDLLSDLIKFFEIESDYKFDINDSTNNLTLGTEASKLSYLSAQILSEASKLFAQEKPDLVIVQGDTMTVQQVALAAFYHKIQIAHIEAGIRTHDIYAPFPEELARRIVSQVANLNFAPTPKAFELLENEKVLFNKKHAQNFLVGNPVIDSLLDTVNKIETPNFIWDQFQYAQKLLPCFDNLDSHEAFKLTSTTNKDPKPTLQTSSWDLVSFIENAKSQNKKIILVTAHRRENISAHPNLVEAIYKVAQEHEGEIEIIISLHKNPGARKAFITLQQKLLNIDIKESEPLHQEVNTTPNIHLLEAINYPLFIKLMKEAYLILTDSGGIQEEAPYLKTPVLVFRNETERQESIESGGAKLIGTKSEDIYQETTMLLNNSNAYKSMIIDAHSQALYGSGDTAQQIAEQIMSQLAVKALI